MANVFRGEAAQITLADGRVMRLADWTNDAFYETIQIVIPTKRCGKHAYAPITFCSNCQALSEWVANRRSRKRALTREGRRRASANHYEER